MKNLILFLLVQLCICGCADYLPTTINEAEKAILLQVECLNRNYTEGAVMQLLRLHRVNDVDKQIDNTSLFIKARFQELSYDKAMQIHDALKSIPEVLEVQFIRDGLPVRNVR